MPGEKRFYPFSKRWEYTQEEFEALQKFNFTYWKRGNFTWGTTTYRGVTCWNPPTDLWAFQEIIERQKPELVIEAGTGPGGTSLWLADVMKREVSGGIVATIDIAPDDFLDTRTRDIWRELGNVEFIHGSSTDDKIFSWLKKMSEAVEGNVLVILDSDHSAPHVKRELELYSQLVRDGNYIVVCDTMVPGPRTAVEEFLNGNDKWCQDPFPNRYMLSFCFGGFLLKSPTPPRAVITVIGMNDIEKPEWYEGEEWGHPNGFSLGERVE